MPWVPTGILFRWVYVARAIWSHIRRNYGQHNRWHSQRIPCRPLCFFIFCSVLSLEGFCALCFLVFDCFKRSNFEAIVRQPFCCDKPGIHRVVDVMRHDCEIWRRQLHMAAGPFFGIDPIWAFSRFPNFRGRIPSTGCKNGLHWIREN